MVLPSPLNHFSFSSFIQFQRRKGKGKIAWAVLTGAILFFLAFFLYGLNHLVQGRPLAGVATLTAFLFSLWLTVQVFTL